MSATGKIILITASVLGVLYFRIYKSVKDLLITLEGFTLEVIHKDFIRLGILIDATNNSSIDVKIEKIDINLLINGRYAGTLVNPYVQYIPERSTNRLFFTVDLLYSSLGKELFEMFKNGSDYKFSLTIQGVIYLTGLPIPIPTTFVESANIKELLEKWK